MMTTESQEIADLFRNPRRRSQPLNTVASHTYGTSATGEADPGGGGETGHAARRLGARGSFTSRVVPSDDSMTPDDYLGASVGSGGGSYDPYGGGGYTSPFESFYDGPPEPPYDPYEVDPYFASGSYDPYGGGGYDPYDPYAAEDARLSSLAAGMPDSTAPSFGSGGMSGSPAPWYTDRDLPIPSESGVPSAPTSSPSDYYSSPEWLRMLASIQGGLASGAI